MRLEVRFNGFCSPYKQIRVEFSADDSEETVRMSIIAAAATALSGRTMRATCDTRAKLYTASGADVNPLLLEKDDLVYCAFDAADFTVPINAPFQAPGGEASAVTPQLASSVPLPAVSSTALAVPVSSLSLGSSPLVVPLNLLWKYHDLFPQQKDLEDGAEVYVISETTAPSGVEFFLINNDGSRGFIKASYLRRSNDNSNKRKRS